MFWLWIFICNLVTNEVNSSVIKQQVYVSQGTSPHPLFFFKRQFYLLFQIKTIDHMNCTESVRNYVQTIGFGQAQNCKEEILKEIITLGMIH